MGKIVELDVRDDLQKKLEPFQKIMDAVQGLEYVYPPAKPITALSKKINSDCFIFSPLFIFPSHLS
ncbi:hypothetical protein SAMN05216169_101447 [Anoxybacillus pushchinoensis]|uniref:Uncharacterized protein n=1 Tax=Anoxybacillus pushchinoensis TaxID=150248 RepID=A0A1I0T531_9BACL|nr:hypothetical protein [Anoxybacillus pushchinoensis]SFA46894.1 hypothetical protein SAMN05216169_101447 [Anoxybacillus pushchinoensis]